ncbi:MAG: glycosyltransferase, partial [Thermodesulfobacteriota bacterium]
MIPVIHIITMLELGGAQQNTLYTVAHLDRRAFRPYLIAGKGGILDPDATALGDVPCLFLPDLRREILPHRDILALRQIRSGIRAIRRANSGRRLIVHTHSSKAGILG